MNINELYVIVNGVTAEVQFNKVYQDKLEAIDKCSKHNQLGTLAVISLESHISALHSWFDKGVQDIGRD